MMNASHVWIWYTTVGVVLTVATIAAIRGGLTSRHAMTAIRLAQGEVIAARSAHPDTMMPQALQDAEAMISTAYEALEARRYEEAIAAARKASQMSHGALKQDLR
ncbi:MAG TPA: hypothetical protein DDX89_05455 [Candidatus Omnitrophica bacterium]|nr:MAG: hypothetical protein A3I71_01645 [Omnitrophica WOR_2 bacterium RIFCSPLOWO2_02_FULL_63_16]OGX48430.1 MAG: hypothetical protein A3G88_06395 [Omnitrophica WOR_2 bacterium RIFCSPLOWO2_12_FULL_63_16]HBH97220.1 hypothetical protein [Candidatus Omnitrophota bacterium]HBQ37808.1 hypothetical protein [Candidatus Omnitrophota bacterium]